MGDLFIRGQSGGGSDAESIESAVITLVPSSFTYDGNEKSQAVASVVLDGATLTEGTDYVVIGNKATDAGQHTLTVVGVLAYTGAATANWSIAKATLTKPAISTGSFTYEPGTPRTPILNAAYDSTTMILSGDTSATDAGSYTLTVALRDTDNYEWGDHSTAPITLSWSIGKKPLTKPTISSGSFVYEPNTTRTPTTDSAYSSATMSKGGDTDAINAGDYALEISLLDTDNYQWDGGGTAPLSLPWSIAKAQGVILASPASVSIQGIGGTETATITKTGDGNVSVSSSAPNRATATISGNTITITGVASGTATITVTLAEGDNYLGASAQISAEVITTRIYGVSWPKTSTTKLSRTDDAALFTDPVPAVSGGSGSSPFDNRLPWSGMVRETISGNEMVKIPKFWFKWTNQSGKLALQIADNATDGFHVAPAHADRGDGKGERDYVYIGRYHCNSAYKSVTGASPVSNITRDTARSGCKGLGTGFYQLDYAMWWTVRMLYLVEYADWDSQTVIGYGCGNNSAKQNTGASDSMTYHTGTMQSSRTAYGVGVQYRYIEDPWGNVLDWCDGIVMSSNAAYVCNDPSKYGDSTSNHTKVSNGISSGNCISGWDVPTFSGLEWALYPNATVSNGNYSTYCADHADANSSSVVVSVGGDYGQSRYNGMFCSVMGKASNRYGNIGARLQYLP